MTDYRDIADRLGVAVDALEAAAAGSRPGVAFLLIKTAHMQASAAAAGISCLPGVRWAAEVRGREASVLAAVSTADYDALATLIAEQIAPLPDVEDVSILLVVDTQFCAGVRAPHNGWP